MVEYVAPVAEHVDDDAAVFFFLVIPGRTLRRNGVTFEYPVTKLTPHRENISKEAILDQALHFHQARQKKLVLHHAVFHTTFLADAVQFQRRFGGGGGGFFAVDVLTGGGRLSSPRRPVVLVVWASKVNGVLRIVHHFVQVGGVLGHARHGAELL